MGSVSDVNTFWSVQGPRFPSWRTRPPLRPRPATGRYQWDKVVALYNSVEWKNPHHRQCHVPQRNNMTVSSWLLGQFSDWWRGWLLHHPWPAVQMAVCGPRPPMCPAHSSLSTQPSKFGNILVFEIRKLDLQSIVSSPDFQRWLIRARQIQWSELGIWTWDISLTP